MPHKTDWFHDRKWGVFIHYLNSVQNLGDPSGELSWSDHVDKFDVELLASQLKEANAGYLFLTVMQRSRHLCIPSKRYDEITGYEPGVACSKRDLVLDLYEALSNYDIELMLYFTGDGPMDDEQAGQAFKYTTHAEHVSMDFVNNWASVLEELSVRYGNKIKGWWIDGCHPCIGYDSIKCGIYADAIRKGNPDAIVSYNASVGDTVESFSSCDDFTAGERNWFDDIPRNGRFVGNAQWHLLSFLGYDTEDFLVHCGWGHRGCKYSPEYMNEFVKAIIKKDGVVSIDVAMDRYGKIAPEHFEILKALKEVRG